MVAEDIAEAITTLKKDGKIRDFGISNFTPSQMEMIGLRMDIDVNQIEFSLTQHTAMHDGTLDYIKTCGIKPMAWSPFFIINQFCAWSPAKTVKPSFS